MATEVRAPWEETLERIERSLELEARVVPPAERDVQTWLQLVIAQQLRELVQAVRPLLNHPLIRR